MLAKAPRKIPKNYTEVIREVFHKRALKNENYSLRAFARDLGLSSGHLSDILNGKAGLSLEKANSIALKLNLSSEDQNLFLKLCEISQDPNNSLLDKQILNFDSTYLKISDDFYTVLTNWYYFALVELVRVVGFRNDDRWIALRLNLPPEEIRQMIDRLLRVKLLEEVDGKLLQTYDYFVSPSGTPSDSARKLHKQILQKAIQSIDEQEIEERDYTSGFLRVRKSDVPAISKRIKEFRRQLAKEIEDGEDHDSVYCLSIQFFRGDQDVTS